VLFLQQVDLAALSLDAPFYNRDMAAGDLNSFGGVAHGRSPFPQPKGGDRLKFHGVAYAGGGILESG
jgi:hypothetical protein